MVEGPDYGTRFDHLFGQSPGSSASIRATARALGVSRDTVSRMRAGRASPRGEAALLRAERREARKPQWLDNGPDRGILSKMIPVEGVAPSERDVRGQLEIVALRRRDGNIDRAATAQAFGVSTSTVGRWLRGEARPTMAHQAELRQEVRSRLLTDSEDAMGQAFIGAKVFLKFRARVSSDVRPRAVERYLDPSAMRGVHAAWLSGGEAGLAEFLALDIEANYFREGGADDAEVFDFSEASLIKGHY